MIIIDFQAEHEVLGPRHAPSTVNLSPSVNQARNTETPRMAPPSTATSSPRSSCLRSMGSAAYSLGLAGDAVGLGPGRASIGPELGRALRTGDAAGLGGLPDRLGHRVVYALVEGVGDELLTPGQLGDGLRGGQLHLHVDAGRAGLERT